MSGGGSDATQTTQNQQQLPPWLDSAGQYAAGQGSQYLNSQYNPLQMGAATTAGQWGQMAPGALGQAYNTFSSNANYQPDQGGYGYLTQLLGGGSSNSGMGGLGGISPHANAVTPTAAQAATVNVDPSQLGQYQSGQLSNTDLSAYLNPYTQDVTNTTLQGLNQNLAQQQAMNSAGAASAGAFGGSRAGVQAALTNQAGQQTAASALAQLNQANYANAQQGAQFDITGQNQASQFNNAALNAALMANAGYGNQANQFNAGQQNQLTQQQMQDISSENNAATAAGASMFGSNAAAQSSRYGNQLQAALGLAGLQQSGSLDAAQLRQQAGSALQGFGSGGLGAQGTMGNQMYNQPMQNLSWYTGMLGNIPYGQQRSSNSTSTQGTNPWAQYAGYAATLASLYGQYAG